MYCTCDSNGHSRQKRHIVWTPLAPPTTSFRGKTRLPRRDHTTLPFKPSRVEGANEQPCLNDALFKKNTDDTRVQNKTKPFPFAVQLYCAFMSAVPDWRLINYWVDCECNRVVWALPLPSAVLECLYIKSKKKCVQCCVHVVKMRKKNILITKKTNKKTTDWWTKQAG